jgi:RNA polymerase sigma factor (sigma-70 family)
MRLRATLKLRNDKMLNARESLGMNQTELAHAAGVTLFTVAAFEALNFAIKDAEDKAVQVAVVLGLPVDDVLPEGLAGLKLPSIHRRSFEANASCLLATRERLTLPSPDQQAGGIEFRDAIAKVLHSLTYREREVIKLRFGLGGDKTTFSREECGKIFRVTAARIKQVEENAIRKMQHPRRSRRLESFLPGEVIR